MKIGSISNYSAAPNFGALVVQKSQKEKVENVLRTSLYAPQLRTAAIRVFNAIDSESTKLGRDCYISTTALTPTNGDKEPGFFIDMIQEDFKKGWLGSFNRKENGTFNNLPEDALLADLEGLETNAIARLKNANLAGDDYISYKKLMF